MQEGVNGGGEETKKKEKTSRGRDIFEMARSEAARGQQYWGPTHASGSWARDPPSTNPPSTTVRPCRAPRTTKISALQSHPPGRGDSCMRSSLAILAIIRASGSSHMLAPLKVPRMTARLCCSIGCSVGRYVDGAALASPCRRRGTTPLAGMAHSRGPQRFHSIVYRISITSKPQYLCFICWHAVWPSRIARL